MKKKKLLVAAILATSAAFNVNAAYLSLDGEGGSMVIPSNNEIFSDGYTQYNIGSNLYADEEVNLTFTYLGHEAAYDNDFFAYGGGLNNKGNSVGDSYSVSGVDAGILEFEFASNAFTPTMGISNGANEDFGSWQSFATLLNYEFNGIMYDAIILFDDSGAGPDDNHDDHIIGIQAQAVPEPSSVALFLLGIAGLMVSRRRLS